MPPNFFLALIFSLIILLIIMAYVRVKLLFFKKHFSIPTPSIILADDDKKELDKQTKEFFHVYWQHHRSSGWLRYVGGKENKGNVSPPIGIQWVVHIHIM